MRPETVFILSSLDVRTLAEFPPALDPCVNEALRNKKVIHAMASRTLGSLEPLTRADFGGTELVEDNLPESLTAWYQAACSGHYDIHTHIPRKIRGLYRVARCEMGNTGSHGGCRSCMMCKVRWEPITPGVPVEIPILPIEPEIVPGVPVRPMPVAPPIVADNFRKLDVNVREAAAKAIITVAVAEIGEISTPTPIPGVVMPKPETGLPPLPITIPTMVMQIPAAEVKGANTIEFQELIPGIKPPAIPLLIPGLEKLPLLPGWTVRNPEGRVVSEGTRIPTLPPGMIGIKIPGELSQVPEEAPATLELENMVQEEYHPNGDILEDTGVGTTPTVPAEIPSDDALELGNNDKDEETVLSVEQLEDEPLEL